jgi:hypothetical protein
MPYQGNLYYLRLEGTDPDNWPSSLSDLNINRAVSVPVAEVRLNHGSFELDERNHGAIRGALTRARNEVEGTLEAQQEEALRRPRRGLAPGDKVMVLPQLASYGWSVYDAPGANHDPVASLSHSHSGLLPWARDLLVVGDHDPVNRRGDTNALFIWVHRANDTREARNREGVWMPRAALLRVDGTDEDLLDDLIRDQVPSMAAMQLMRCSVQIEVPMLAAPGTPCHAGVIEWVKSAIVGAIPEGDRGQGYIPAGNRTAENTITARNVSVRVNEVTPVRRLDMNQMFRSLPSNVQAELTGNS